MIKDTYIKGVATGGGGSVGAKLMKTNQTTSYATGDDGDLQIGNRAMNYSPIDQGAGNNRYWTSTTLTGYTNQPYFGSNAWQGGGIPATQSYEWLGCRNFTVTGTTLT